MNKVTVYVTSYCGFCHAAKRWLKSMGIAFDEFDVTHDPDRRNWLVEKSGMRTVPQIFVGETSVGGYQEMLAMDRRGEFRPLLDAEGVAYNG